MNYNIVIVTGGLVFNGNSLQEKSLGGSETAVIYLAKELKKLGNIVTVFCNCDKEDIYEGVNYLNLSRINDFIDYCECDILVVSRFYDFFKSKFNSKLNILWNHDILAEKEKLISVCYNIDYMYCLSDFHKQQFIEQLPELEHHIKIIHNGVDFSLIKEKEKKHKIMFTSRPERGLFKALEIYEKLNDKELEFLVCNYQTIADPQVARIEDICYCKMEELGQKGFNIQLGSFTKEQLYEHIAESKAVIYPTEFPEIFCISAIEARANGTIFLTVNDFALKETASFRINNDEEFDINFSYQLETILKNDEYRKKIEKNEKENINNFKWDLIAEKFIDDAENEFKKRSQDSDKIIQRLIYESDLIAARELAIKTKNEDKIKFLNNSLRFVDNPENLKKIYEDEETHEKIDLPIEEMERNTRFKWLSEQVEKYEIKSLLDFACHMGMSSIVTSNRNPDCKITGYDISEKAIRKANLRREKYAKYKENLYFTNDLSDLGKYDAIFIGEYLEHVKNPEKELEKLEKYVVDGGKIFFTVPRGGWEYLSHLENIKKDVYYHVNNFDANDIQSMVGHKPNFKYKSIRLMTGAYTEPMGNYLVQYTKNDSKIGKRDLERKFFLSRPYVGISACIIAKNAEKEIERMLDSINFEVDEILVALDHKPNENKKLEDRLLTYPKVKVYYLPKSIHMPDMNGFANARNFICEKAKYDWILWIDSDEQLITGNYLKKYIDNNIFNAFIIRQHHVQFDNFIEADIPSRLFRKNAGKFYGYIHEQVMSMDDINAPIKPSLIIDDAHILNFGELTEFMRRTKSLDRNLPLLYRDVQENVDERTKNGLPVRKLSVILLMRDFINRMMYAKERFKTYRCRDNLEFSLPKIEALYAKYFAYENDSLYKNLAYNLLQKAFELVGKGDRIELKVNEKAFSFRTEDFDFTEIKKILEIENASRNTNLC